MHNGTKVEFNGKQGKLVRFDARKVEDVVDDPQQSISRTECHFGQVLLFGRESGFVQQLEHAGNPIQGGTKLMAHIGQK